MLATLALTILLTPLGAAGAGAPPSHVKAELLTEQVSIQPGKPFSVALRLTMKDGWHTYWRNPGDSGMATSVTWKLPSGFTASAAQWSRPRRFAAPHSATYGYSDAAILIFDLKAPPRLREGAPVLLSAKAKWLECRDVCVPGGAELTIRLPARSAAPRKDPAFSRLRAEVPARLPEGWTARAFRDDGRVRLRVEAAPGAQGFVGPDKGIDIVFFPHGGGIIDNGQETTVRTDGPTLTLELPQSRARGAAKAKRLTGVLAINHQARAYEVSVPIEKVGP